MQAILNAQKRIRFYLHDIIQNPFGELCVQPCHDYCRRKCTELYCCIINCRYTHRTRCTPYDVVYLCIQLYIVNKSGVSCNEGNIQGERS